MNLSELKSGTRAVVLEVELPAPLKERLRSLNVCTGSKITLLKVSTFKKSFLIQARGAKIALGREVAEKIRVWKLA